MRISQIDEWQILIWLNRNDLRLLTQWSMISYPSLELRLLAIITLIDFISFDSLYEFNVFEL